MPAPPSRTRRSHRTAPHERGLWSVVGSTAGTKVVVMGLSGALAGLAGANQVLGVIGRVSPNFTGGIGFDAIAVALLGRSHPLGVLVSGLLFGALQAGGRQMQVSAGVSLDLIAVIQALIIIFIAAPVLFRMALPWLFEAKAKPQVGGR